jgi:tRNA(fMet)-specific endonuclease VapC
MSLFVLDTDILSLYYDGDPLVCQRVSAKPANELAITVMPVDEQLTGWYTVTRQARQPIDVADAYAMLGDAVVRLARWRILPYTVQGIARFSQLKGLRLNVGGMDLRIAAITLEHGGIVVTRNVRDFQRVPGLTVENWAV